MASSDSSLLVLLKNEEYCFLYDRQSVPELLESLLAFDGEPESAAEDRLDIVNSREVARGLLGRVYQEI